MDFLVDIDDGEKVFVLTFDIDSEDNEEILDEAYTKVDEYIERCNLNYKKCFTITRIDNLERVVIQT